MIKLKQLLKETGASKRVWSSPKDAPMPVVDVLHRIVADAIRQNKNTDDYVKLSKSPSGEWVIQNPSNRDISLFYDEHDSIWWAVGWPPGSAEKEVGYIKPEQLRQIIDGWIK